MKHQGGGGILGGLHRHSLGWKMVLLFKKSANCHVSGAGKLVFGHTAQDVMQEAQSKHHY